MPGATTTQPGREAFAERRWADAYAQLRAADQSGGLDADDLARLADAAHLTGRISEGIEIRTRAYQAFVARGEAAAAARCAFWNGMHLMYRGEMAPAGGWFARCQRTLDESEVGGVEQGMTKVPAALQSLFSGDPESAHDAFRDMRTLATRFRDADFYALSHLGLGRSLLALERSTEGIAMLDEAMTFVTAGEVSPIVSGIVYCGVIGACHECFDIRRAREWTSALKQWCDSQPDLVPFRGQCLVHRAQILQLGGDWRDAVTETERACDRMAEGETDPAIGAAYSLLGDLYRLRGDFDAAEEAYKRANQSGQDPQPGLALLRLAQGQVAVATATIRRLLEETQQSLDRTKLLPAAVEILLAADDVPTARTAADELSKVAEHTDRALLLATAEHACGAVSLAEGDPRGALGCLRVAWRSWHELEAPYEAARTRVVMARALRAIGDDDSAELELDAARAVFEDVGAEPDIAVVDRLSARSRSAVAGLTPRELEVLRLVASGKPNKAIATELVLSEKTVERHLSNIFTKLGVSSRAAATAFAYENDLV